MSKIQKISLLLLRVSIGWLFLYAGISKFNAASWSAAGYLNSAKTLPSLYHWFASPGVLPITNILNEYGQILIGISLIIGLFVRYSSIAGILMMVLYYIPILNFPMVGEHSYIVDEHVIYSFVLLVLAVFRAGKVYGLDGKFSRAGNI